MSDRVTGDRVEETPRRELDRKNLDAVQVGGVLTDASAPVRLGGIRPKSNQSSTLPPTGATSSLTIEELDGDPSVSGVSKIIVPNDSLTDDGDGKVALVFPIERYPIPIKITLVRGLDANSNRLYNVVELDGTGNELVTTHNNVPNVGRPAATLEAGNQAEMGYSLESDSFFFSEAS